MPLNHRSPGLLLVFTLLLLVSTAPARAQSMSQQQRADIERRIRESRARIEAAQRKARGEPSWRTSPFADPPQSATQGQGLMSRSRGALDPHTLNRNEPEYKFDGGREFAYRFVLGLTGDEGTSYIAGYAAFNDPIVVGSTPLTYPVRVVPAPEPGVAYAVDAGGRGGVTGVRGQVVRLTIGQGAIRGDEQFRVR